MDMHRLDKAPFFPQACLCGNQTGPFVDTGMEKPVSGRVYVCERCIADLATTQSDWVEREHYDRAVAAMARSEQEVGRLMTALELERRPESKVISVQEIPAVVKAVVIDLETERKKRRPATKAAS